MEEEDCDLDVESTYPGAAEGTKGWTVRPLKRFVI